MVMGNPFIGGITLIRFLLNLKSLGMGCMMELYGWIRKLELGFLV